jgi:TRAP-type C4-dicarboxylate transport system permease small subunit
MLLLSMLGVVTLQIFYRYVLDTPLVWTEELARTVFIWIVFLGGAYAAMDSAHLKLDLWGGKGPQWFVKLNRIVGAYGIIIFSIVVIYSGFRMVELTAMRSMPSTGLSYAWFHAAAPIGASLTLIGLCLSFRRLSVSPANKDAP